MPGLVFKFEFTGGIILEDRRDVKCSMGWVGGSRDNNKRRDLEIGEG